jgi:hypothetical protein
VSRCGRRPVADVESYVGESITGDDDDGLAVFRYRHTRYFVAEREKDAR